MVVQVAVVAEESQWVGLLLKQAILVLLAQVALEAQLAAREVLAEQQFLVG
jgi:hypothetical protein